MRRDRDIAHWAQPNEKTGLAATLHVLAPVHVVYPPDAI